MNGLRTDGREYEYHNPGRRLPQFEVERRVHESQLVRLVFGSETKTVTVEAPIPDLRIALTLALQFVPTDPGESPTPDFSDSTLWLAACSDLGGGYFPDEDLLGSAASPVAFVDPGLWGAHYTVRDAELVRATMSFDPAHAAVGYWVAKAKWTAQYPMGQQEWEEAVGRMSIVSRGGRS
jgi:hypothetical protein